MPCSSTLSYSLLQYHIKQDRLSNNDPLYYDQDVALNLTSNYTTACHAGQQRQPGLARGSKQPNANGAKRLTIRSGRPGLYLVSIHQMAPPERGAHIR